MRLSHLKRGFAMQAALAWCASTPGLPPAPATRPSCPCSLLWVLSQDLPCPALWPLPTMAAAWRKVRPENNSPQLVERAGMALVTSQWVLLEGTQGSRFSL